MGKFCTSCGSALNPNAKFCENCGAPVQAPVEENINEHPTPVQSTVVEDKSEQNAPVKEQEDKNKEINNKAPNKKKKHTGIIIVAAIVVIVTVIIIIAVSSNSGSTRPTKYDDDVYTIEALIDYAERMEKAGNYEAAAQIYSLLPKAGEGELRTKINKVIFDNPAYKTIDSLNEAYEFYNAVKGAK